MTTPSPGVDPAETVDRADIVERADNVECADIVEPADTVELADNVERTDSVEPADMSSQSERSIRQLWHLIGPITIMGFWVLGFSLWVGIVSVGTDSVTWASVWVVVACYRVRGCVLG